MKAKVIIQDGITQVILTPTSDFERDLIEKMYNKQKTFAIDTEVRAEYELHSYQTKLKNHEIVLTIEQHEDPDPSPRDVIHR
jgi:hypothetical protein